ncbi:MAG: hypothetical protein LBV75_08240, partial [Paludibacter sp.]|nr:hypothetical protein [Paludibacter sp.]
LQNRNLTFYTAELRSQKYNSIAPAKVTKIIQFPILFPKVNFFEVLLKEKRDCGACSDISESSPQSHIN